MRGPFYRDTLRPFMVADLAAVTLSTTDKALYPAAAFPNLGGQFFNAGGDKLHVRLFGKITTGTTPGNLTFDLYWGSGADATGIIIASSAAFALTASQTNLSWTAEFWIRCITPGSAGSLYVTGEFGANVGVVASTLQPVMIPASAAAASASVDLTAASIISIQAKRSGSTAETMTVQDLQVEALN